MITSYYIFRKFIVCCSGSGSTLKYFRSPFVSVHRWWCLLRSRPFSPHIDAGISKCEHMSACLFEVVTRPAFTFSQIMIVLFFRKSAECCWEERLKWVRFYSPLEQSATIYEVHADLCISLFSLFIHILRMHSSITHSHIFRRNTHAVRMLCPMLCRHRTIPICSFGSISQCGESWIDSSVNVFPSDACKSEMSTDNNATFVFPPFP